MSMTRVCPALLTVALLAAGSAACSSASSEEAGQTHDRVTASVSYDADALIADLQAYESRVKGAGAAPDRNEFLATLPAQFKRRYTVLSESGAEDSVDGADPTDGRVLAFGDSGALTIAWTRDASGFQIAQHRGSHLELRHIDFVGGKVAVSPPNPAGCASSDCHGAQNDPRLRWDAYPSWPKAFAKDNDFVKPGAEEARVRKFFESAAKHPAFSMLERDFGVEGTIGTFRVGNAASAAAEAPSGAKAAATSAGTTTEYAPGTAALSYQFRPNTFLTLVYARMHAEQIFAKLAANGSYPIYEYPLLFVLSRCEWPADDAAGREEVNRILAAQAGSKTAPRIDVGPTASQWMPWFEFLGVSAERVNLSDERRAPAIGGLRQDHAYNEGFTGLASFVGARVSENILARRPDWASLYLQGKNARVESVLFGNLAYEGPAALQSQVKTLDGLGSFLDVEPRSYLTKARPADHAARSAATCDALRKVVRQQFHLK